MNSRDPITKALGKLDWITKLSKESFPGGAPRDFESTRTLLNRIVLDVWAASKLMKETQEQGKSDLSDKSDRSEQENKCPGLIPTHGGYRKLKSFQVTEKDYERMMIFLKRFVEKHSRTHDQMGQAALSSRLNIAEGSVVSATSKKIELKRQVEKLERNFIEKSGFTERLYRVCRQRRYRQ